jgi:hypothetical protein
LITWCAYSIQNSRECRRVAKVKALFGCWAIVTTSRKDKQKKTGISLESLSPVLINGGFLFLFHFGWMTLL